jgi:histone deacetylase 1/2
MASFTPLDELIVGNGHGKKRINYFYDGDIGTFGYETGHPMKPQRIRLAHSLIMNYGLYKGMEVYVRGSDCPRILIST